MPSRWLLRCFAATRGASRRRVSVVQRGWYQSSDPHFLTRATRSATEVVPLRKQLKDEIKASRQNKSGSEATVKSHDTAVSVADWELTVGIEIHAQLNTGYKLFSNAQTDEIDEPNSSIEPFDVAIPGSQPTLQTPVLIPAIRAALALNCTVQSVSKFDRKHYFYHDQPSGYQITQYYEPLAKNGRVTLGRDDGLKVEDGDDLNIGIKQVQLEQDTARTQEQDAETNLIDFNRSGHPLIEIISLPQIHSPEAAAAYVRKVQSLLYSVDAVTTGMELGGLRADVNVSVRHKNDQSANHSYSGIGGLGQRTEIKNLSSFKAVEDAVKAERDRQISVLEAGGVVEGETRGWSLSRPGETRRLRGKEGEVDYRYMPDPDIPPLCIDDHLVHFLRQTLPPVPEHLLHMLRSEYGLSILDAQAILTLDDGERLIYFQEVIDLLPSSLKGEKWSKTAGNWVLHELGALLTTNNARWTPDLVPAQNMADIIEMQATNEITGTSAKQLLRIIFEGDKSAVRKIATREKLLFQAMNDDEYKLLVARALEENPQVVEDIVKNKKQGKLNFLLGQMMRMGDRNRIEAKRAEAFLRAELGL